MRLWEAEVGGHTQPPRPLSERHGFRLARGHTEPPRSQTSERPEHLRLLGERRARGEHGAYTPDNPCLESGVQWSAMLQELPAPPCTSFAANGGCSSV